MLLLDKKGNDMNLIRIEKEEMREEKNLNIKVEEAAKILHKSPQFIRVALQQGILPIGIAVKVSDKRWNYHISRKKLEEYIGSI